MKKLLAVAVCVAVAGLTGCASGPQKAPNGMNLYLEPEFDKALIDGANEAVDLARLADVSAMGAVSQADQYAVELVSTTKFDVIRDAFVKVGNSHDGETRLDRGQRIWSAFQPYRKRGATVREQFNGFLKTMGISDFVDAEVVVGGWSRSFFVEGTAGAGRSPLRIQQATISGAWRVIGYAKEAAENIRLGRPQEAGVDGNGGDAYFQTQGCGIYADRALLAKKRSQDVGSGILGTVMKINSAPLVWLESTGAGGRQVPYWSEKRCSATFEAVPASLVAYKMHLKK